MGVGVPTVVLVEEGETVVEAVAHVPVIVGARAEIDRSWYCLTF